MGSRCKIFWIIFLLSFWILSPLSFAAENPPIVSRLPAGGEVAKYENLLKAIRATRHASQARIEQAARQEKVREAWETGKLIDEHILQHKERADYGEQVIVRLAEDLETSRDELYRMLRFYRTYPIVVPGQQLSWSHYKALLSVHDQKQREEIAEEAIQKHWSKHELRRQIQTKNISTKNLPADEPVLTAVAGKVNHYRVVVAKSGEYQGERVIDLGFSNYYRPDKKLRFDDRDIVEFVKGKFSKTGEGPDVLFTYKADVVEVLDGDTMNAIVHLGLGFLTYQTLRLRGIDAPELVSEDGKEAKAFLEKQISGKSVLIKTTKSDKYDRYLADVWVRPWPIDHSPKNAKDTAVDHGPSTMDYVYINQQLLDNDLATVMND